MSRATQPTADVAEVADVDLAFAMLPGAALHRHLAALRAEGPLARSRFGGQPAFLVTTRALLLEAFLDVDALPPATLYQNSIAKIIGPNFQSMEGAQHRLYRRLATPAFRSRAVERYEREGMAELAHELIDRLAGRREVDLVSEFTHRFPFLAISRLLGVPRDREAQFHQWAWEMLGPPGVDPVVSRKAAAEFTHYLAPTIEARRREPRDDVISGLVQARADGRQLTDDEVLAHIRLVFSAGATTTCDAIGNLLFALLTETGTRDADGGVAWERVVADPGLRASAVQEGLRWETPVANLPRISADREVELGGCRLPAGSTVLLGMAAANRDPEVYESPDRFDLTRNPSDLLTFGRGERSCPGMHLAHKEIAVALDALAESFPRLRLRGEPLESAPQRAIVRGPQRLLVALD